MTVEAANASVSGARKFDMRAVLSEWSVQSGLRFMNGDQEVPVAEVFSERTWLPMIVSRAEVSATELFQLASLGCNLFEDQAAAFGVAVKPVYVERNERDEFANVEQMLKAALLLHATRQIFDIHRMRQVIRLDERMRHVQGLADGQDGAQAAQRRA